MFYLCTVFINVKSTVVFAGEYFSFRSKLPRCNYVYGNSCMFCLIFYASPLAYSLFNKVDIINTSMVKKLRAYSILKL